METLTALGFCVIAFGLGFICSRMIGSKHIHTGTTITVEKGAVVASKSAIVALGKGKVDKKTIPKN